MSDESATKIPEGSEIPKNSGTNDEAAPGEKNKVVNRRPTNGQQRISRTISKNRTVTIESSKSEVKTEREKLEEEASAWRMPEGFFYDKDSPELVAPIADDEIPRAAVKAEQFLGFDFHRCQNILWTAQDEFAYVTGHVVVFTNLNTGQSRRLSGRDDGGIGGIAISPDRKHFAVAEKSVSSQPKCYIYTFHGFNLYRILKKGTERGFACVQFSPHDKSQLALLGCAPDYLLSVWDWRNERLLLKCKAYGQDISCVRWGQFPGMLTTVGVGHIKFWKMALTFTGLKLQGVIGKFGATDLSDITGFVELPDGKIVTGSEYGKLLLWEGIFVKVELMRGEQDNPLNISGQPHVADIDVIVIDKSQNCVVSGGSDGYLRWWPIDEIDEAEADYDNGILEYGISMRKEVKIPPDDEETFSSAAHIQHIACNDDDSVWLLQDVANGVVWRFQKDNGMCTPVLQSHSKQITGALVLPQYPGLVISAGIDGTLRAYSMAGDQDHELFFDKRGGAGICCMAMAPEMVDPEKRTVICGYADGTVRAFAMCRDGFVLIQAVKPANCPIVQIEYTVDGTLLACMGADNSVFFFEVRGLADHAVPLGFMQIPNKVNSFGWRPDGARVLLASDDGSLVELVKPDPETIDNVETYAIELDYRAIMPELPEPDVKPEEEREEDEGEGEASEDPQGEKPKKKKQETAAETEAAAEKDGDEDQEATKEVRSSILRMVYNSEDGDDIVFFVGTGRYSGGLWEISLVRAQIQSHSTTPLGQHVPVPSMCKLRAKLPEGIAVTHMSISPTGRFLFVGFANGQAWIIPIQNMTYHSIISLGDSASGPITSMHCDNAESMMIVGAGDGSLTTVKMNCEEVIKYANTMARGGKVNHATAAAAIEETMPELPVEDPSTWELAETENPGFPAIGKDITDSKQYSIQDAKLKSEEDNAKAQAEKKKQGVRERIAEIRLELEELMARNANVPYNQLVSSELTIDLDQIAHLRDDMERQVENVNTELAWSVEFHETGMQKLKEHYLGRLDFERIEVLAFRSPHRVSTFRCPAMSLELQSNLARLHELIFAADRESDEEEGGASELGKSRKGSVGDGPKGAATSKGDAGNVGDIIGADSGRKGEVLSGAEQRELRRKQRQQRKQQMAELEKSKPSDSYEDPKDVEAIASAEATLGNFMLKTSSSYQVPENQRMNAEKKRRQMFLLEESMHAIKTEFNHRVFALRDFRQQVQTEVQRDLTALQEIDHQLGTSTPWVEGILDDPENAPSAFPEKRFTIQDADVKAFAKQLKEGSAGRASPEEPSEPEAGEESFEEEDADQDGRDEDDEEGDVDEEEHEVDSNGGGQQLRKKKERKSHLHANPKATGVTVPLSGRAALAARRVARLTLRTKLLKGHTSGQLPLNKAVAEEAHARLLHDKAQLEDHIKQVIETFNGAVASIEKEKVKLESDLKNADMKLLVLYEELLTLNELEERDEALLKQANKCRQDKTSIMHQISRCQDQLSDKKAEIERWYTEEQNLQMEFTELVGENSPFMGQLLKIYKKKVKRSKRKKAMADDDEEMEEEEDEEEDDEDETDEDEDEEDDTACPHGCDMQIFESVLDLRLRRADFEDALADIKVAVQDLSKDHKNLLNEERNIDKKQKQTDAEIQQFQTDKQRKLNQVPIVFALRLSQVQCLDSGYPVTKLPSELDQHVVFTNEGLKRLMSRITELHQEKAHVKAEFRQLQKDSRVRKKEKNQVMQLIDELEAKFQDIQALRFGQTVDLDLIERSAPNKYVQELRERVLEAEAEHRNRIAEWEKKIERQKKELAKVTAENTSLMEQIVSMGYSQMQLDAALNARIANVTVNDTEPLVEQREMDRERVKDMLALQTKDIASLQAEINLFRQKGGHIYTTVTANRAGAS